MDIKNKHAQLSMKDDIQFVVDWLKNKVEETHTNGILVGLSGGIDSALVGNLIKTACGENCLGVILPCKSSEKDREDAIDVAEKANMEYVEIDLTETHDALLNQIIKADNNNNDAPDVLRLTDANLRARLRMSTIYALANKRGYLVAGTDNAAELLTGYFTKYGDGGVDILPIAHLKKSEVYKWAEYFDVPQRVLKRDPSAGLWEGQTDEVEMGVTYDEIDAYLDGKSISSESTALIEKLNKNSEHKRHMPPRPV